MAANLNSPRRIAARRKLNYEEIVKETCEDRQQHSFHAPSTKLKRSTRIHTLLRTPMSVLHGERLATQ